MSDFTEEDAITAVRMIADGATWCEVVDKLYPDAEYKDLLTELTRERTKWWYRDQSEERIAEVLGE